MKMLMDKNEKAEQGIAPYQQMFHSALLFVSILLFHVSFGMACGSLILQVYKHARTHKHIHKQRRQ